MAREVVVRGGVEPPTFRFSGGRSYQLSYLTLPGAMWLPGAVLTGFEPATSTLTGWRALLAALQDQAEYYYYLQSLTPRHDRRSYALRKAKHCASPTAQGQALHKTTADLCQPYPQRDSNPRRRLERAVS